MAGIDGARPNEDEAPAYGILIVDDEADIRMLMSGILGDEGFRTREAANSAVPYSASSDVSVMILASHQIVAVNQLFFAAVA